MTTQHLPARYKCDACNGTGMITSSDPLGGKEPCPTCVAWGWIYPRIADFLAQFNNMRRLAGRAKTQFRACRNGVYIFTFEHYLESPNAYRYELVVDVAELSWHSNFEKGTFEPYQLLDLGLFLGQFDLLVPPVVTSYHREGYHG